MYNGYIVSLLLDPIRIENDKQCRDYEDNDNSPSFISNKGQYASNFYFIFYFTVIHKFIYCNIVLNLHLDPRNEHFSKDESYDDDDNINAPMSLVAKKTSKIPGSNYNCERSKYANSLYFTYDYYIHILKL